MAPDVKTFSLPEQIADQLADAIVAGTYPPGARIGEQDLADLFAVSRGPIRDALRIVEREGLIRILPRRGTVVARPSASEVTDIFRIQATLVGLAARLVAEKAGTGAADYLEATLAQLDERVSKADAHEFARYCSSLCLLLARTSGSERLEKLLLSMSRQTLALTRPVMDRREHRTEWIADWRGTVHAIAAGNAGEAEAAGRRLVTQAGQRVLDVAASDVPERDRAVASARASAGSTKVIPDRPIAHERADPLFDTEQPTETGRRTWPIAGKSGRIKVLPDRKAKFDLDADDGSKPTVWKEVTGRDGTAASDEDADAAGRPSGFLDD